MKVIGVLALQGSVIEHMSALGKLDDVKAVEVKRPGELDYIDALILPGGESTTISKLLDIFGLTEPLKKRIKSGMPVWGTCAGMILLANDVIGGEVSLGLMDITVRRNAYGRQIDSFRTRARIVQVSDEEIPLIFIRAPWIERTGDNVKILCKTDGHITAAIQDNMLVTSFHPELSEDISFHRFLRDMIK